MGRLGNHLRAALTQGGDDLRLDGRRVDGTPLRTVLARVQQSDLDEQLERLVELPALDDARLSGADAARGDDLFVERAGLLLEQVALVLPQGHGSPPTFPEIPV